MTALNMPAVAVSVDFTHDPTSASFTWVNLTKRSWDFTVTRGRAYELTQVQAGESDVTMENVDGALDPTNTGSTYSPNVKPFRRVKIEATWDSVLHPVYAGLVERWPMEWQDQLSVSPIKCVDYFAMFAQKKLPAAVIGEMLADSPASLHPLDEAAGSTSARDITGNHAAALAASSKYGAGTLTFGADAGVTGVTGGMFITSPDAGNNTSGWQGGGGGGADIARATWLNVPNAVAGAGAFALEMWFVGPSSIPAVGEEMLCQPSPNNVGILSAGIDSGTGHIGAGLLTAAVNVCDGKLHHLVYNFTFGGPGETWLDGVRVTSATLGGGGLTVPVYDWNLGVLRFAGTLEVASPFSGTFALFAQYPAPLSGTRIAAHHAAGTTAFAGETADARIARLLGYAGWTTTTHLDACTTTMLGATGIAGQPALTAIQAVATAEGGAFYIGKDGTPTYQSRRTRMATVASAATFGDGPGEYPYESVSYDFDPTYVYNEIELTRSQGAAASASDTASAATFGERTLSQTMDIASDAEIVDAADWLLASYKDPHVRVASITLHPSAVTSVDLWAVCLGLDIGSRVTVKRRPSGSGNTISGDYFVEQIKTPKLTADDATFQLALSPIPVQAVIADDPVYGLSDTAGLVAAW